MIAYIYADGIQKETVTAFTLSALLHKALKSAMGMKVLFPAARISINTQGGKHV